MPSTAVVIVSYNTRELLRACLATLLPQGPAEVHVADNGSRDGTLEMLRDEFPGVAVSVDQCNRGYAAGANRGVAATRAPYVLLLNTDTLLHPGALAAVAAYLDAHPRAALLGPRLLNANGTLQPSCGWFPGLLASLTDGRTASALVRRVPRLRDRHPAAWDHARPRVVDWVMGAALGMRRSAFDAVGGFDESFFMYYEEVDLARRLRAAGWEVHFAPVTEITHLGGGSAATRADQYVQILHGLLHYYERHYQGPSLAAARAMVLTQTCARWARDAARLGLARDARRRGDLEARVEAWRRVLATARVAASRQPL